MATELLKKTAEALVTHCQNSTEEEGLNTLYTTDAISVEAVAQPGSGGAEAKGLEAIRGKHAWWASSFDVHDLSVEGPMYHGDDRFSVIFGMDVTEKATGERTQMREVGIYTINDAGKICREEFFYAV